MSGSASPTASRRSRPTGLRPAGLRSLLAVGVVTLGMLVAPLHVAAADPSPTPTPSASPTPSPTPTATPPSVRVPIATIQPAPTPTPQPTFGLADISPRHVGPASTLAPMPLPTRVLIYRESAMVKQYTNYWCVPATTQSMINLIKGTSDRSRATQERYYYGTRKHNRYTYATKGNDPQGWAWALRYYSGGITDYQARSFTNKTASLEAIVESIDRTGTPVGVPVHDGTHAWIVLGYRAEPDPDDPTRRVILGFYVSGPLGSPSDPWPYKYLTNSQFRTHFTRYHEWQRDVIWEGRWVIISQ